MVKGEGQSSQVNSSKPKVRVIAPIEGPGTKTQMAPTSVYYKPSRMCAFHQTIPAVYICAKCSKPLCISCAVPHGHLYLCPQCYQPPTPAPTEQERKEPPKPPMESILGLFGALIILVGFFMPWATSNYISPGNEVRYDTVISGFTIAGDYSEVSIIFIMGCLTIIVEFILIFLVLSSMIVKKPPIGIRLLPMFLGLIAYVVLAEIIIRAESFKNNIHVGWFVCVFGVSIIILTGTVEIWKHYHGED